MRRKDREVLDKSDIESIIIASDVCRLAMVNDNIPYIVTMNFGYVGGETPYLYFHCAPEGRKLDMISGNNWVCFEMDTDHEIYSGEKGCDWGMKFSSVVGYGRIYIVDQEEEKIAGLGYILDHYKGSGEYSFDKNVVAKTTVLRLNISEVTGKRK